MKILLIEDSPGDARLVQESLAEAGNKFTVNVAERLEQGSEFLASQQVDIALLDLGLPDSFGLETLTKLQTRFPHLPIVIMTGSNDEALGVQAVQLGAQDYLVKGMVDSKLLERSLVYAIERKKIEEALWESEARAKSQSIELESVNAQLRAEIAERKRAEEALVQRQAHLDRLIQASACILTESTVEGLLQTVVDAARDLTGARLAVSGYGYRNGKFTLGSSSGTEGVAPLTSERIFNIERGGVYMSLIKGQTSLRLTQEELIHHADWWSLPEGHAPLNGLLGVRLTDSGGQADGLVMLTDKEAGEFTEEDESLATQLAALASLALQHIEANAALEQRVQERTQELSRANRQLEKYRQHLEELVRERTTELANERANLQKMFDVVNVGMLLIEQDGSVKRVNNAAARWTGKEPGEMCGIQPGEALGCIHALNDPAGCGKTPYCSTCRIRNAFESVLRAGEPVHDVEVEATLFLGGEPRNLWLDLSADPLEMEGERNVILALNNITALKEAQQALSQARDELEQRVRERTRELSETNLQLQEEVTERKRAVESLRLANAYTRSLIEASLDPLATITPEGKVGDVNTATEKVTGRSRRELIGTDFSEYFTEPEKARLGYRRAFETGGIRDLELSMRHEDGHTTPVLYNASVYRDETGQTRGVFAVARDITDLKQFEDQLVQAEKHAVIGRMVGSVTHEINNPLQTIKNCLYLIQQDTDSDSPIQEPLEMATSEATRLSNLVGQLRELYRPRTDLQQRPCEVLDILEEVHSLLIPHLNNHQVQWRPLAGWKSCYINCVRDQMLEVFLNISTNAIEAMQQTGGILSVGMKFSGKQVGVVFEDTGSGISPEILPHLFEPFATTKNTGLGLGLSISYGIVQRHGGRIVVENCPEGGAAFTVWLPRANARQRSTRSVSLP